MLERLRGMKELPTFLGIGAMRCGTTTLYSCLRQMSDIFLPSIKELNFFDRNFAKGVDYYADYFSTKQPGQIAGEITPDYMYMEECLPRIQETLPHAKFICVLRDPVSRAWSHYKFSVLAGKEQYSFRGALAREEERLKSGGGGYNSIDFYSYRTRGHYIDQLLRFEERFGKDAIKVIFLSELSNSMISVLNDLRSFLGLGPLTDSFILKNTHENKQTQFPLCITLYYQLKKILKQPKKGLFRRLEKGIAWRLQCINTRKTTRPIDHQIANELSYYYQPFDLRLRHWLGRELPW